MPLTREPPSVTLRLAQVADGMSEAEADYTRRLTAAKLQGRSIEEVEKIQNRNIAKEIKKRVQVSSMGSRGSSWQYSGCVFSCKPSSADIERYSI